MTKTVIRRILASLIVLVAAAASADAQKPTFDVTGSWAFEVQTDQGAGSPTITFKRGYLVLVQFQRAGLFADVHLQGHSGERHGHEGHGHHRTGRWRNLHREEEVAGVCLRQGWRAPSFARSSGRAVVQCRVP